jgi:hypothetical protein
MSHRWSGWPGAWCLDCGCEDPREIALAEGIDINVITSENFRTLYKDHPGIDPCKEPGSRRHDPYGKKTES